jgi:hypothetical protein
VFQAYCKWVYSGMIDAIARADEAEEKRSKRDLLFSLYLLGDMLDDIHLRRAATHAVFVGLQVGARLPNPNALAATWSSTPPGSLFRKQLVDYTVAKIDREKFIEIIAHCPVEFLQDVTAAALRKISAAPNWVDGMGDGSQYLEPEEAKDNTN